MCTEFFAFDDDKYKKSVAVRLNKQVCYNNSRRYEKGEGKPLKLSEKKDRHRTIKNIFSSSCISSN